MIKLRVCTAMAAVVILGAALPAFADNYSSAPNIKAGDAEVTAAVKSAIARHSSLVGPNQIYVATRNGVVYLSGIVGSDLAVADAEDLARRVPGVTRVVSTVSITQ